ncbi:MAG: PA14 domain-containing protein, partial [Planctomycetota bacterium]|nr:PA14 domain-containing protein [Planctomycetota bacterium]
MGTATPGGRSAFPELEALETRTLLSSLSIANLVLAEGNSGQKNFDFTVSLSAADVQDVTVHYRTADGMAAGGVDYVPVLDSQVTIPAGQTSAVVRVQVIGDSAYESFETFTVDLFSPTGADIAKGQATGVILNDDVAAGKLAAWGDNTKGQCKVPSGSSFVAIAAGSNHGIALRANGSLAGWGDNTYGQATVPAGSDFVTIAAGYQHNLAIRSDGSIAGWGADLYGQATPPAGTDFVAVAGGSSFSVALRSDGSLVAWGDNSAGQTAVPAGNDFVAIAVGLNQGLALRSDGSVAAWGPGVLGISPSGNDFVAVATGLDFDLALRADGSLVAWGPSNYYGQLNVPAGNNFVAISAKNVCGTALRADGSLAAWGDNRFGQTNVPAGASYVAAVTGGRAGLAISVPAVSINSISQSEGNSGTSPFVFTVTLSAAAASAVSVDWATADGTASAAANDYLSAGGTVSFLPGETSKTVSVLVVGDTGIEPDEQFYVDLSNPSPATVAIFKSRGIGTILSDDVAPTLSINDVALLEGNTGTSALNFTVTLSAATESAVSVNWATANGTASAAAGDYLSASGTVSFQPGETSKTVSVLVNGDTLYETDEQFYVDLSNASPAGIILAKGRGIGTILNDDTGRSLSISDVAAYEDSSVPVSGLVGKYYQYTAGNVNNWANLVLTRVDPTIDFNWGNGSPDPLLAADLFSVRWTGLVKAVYTETYTFQTNSDDGVRLWVNNQLVIDNWGDHAPTVNTGTIALVAGQLYDIKLEYYENGGGAVMQLSWSSPSTPLQFVPASQLFGSANSPTKVLAFTVSLSEPSPTEVRVSYATADDTASAVTGDYTPASGTIILPANATTATINIQVTGDTSYELDERFYVNLSNPWPATVAIFKSRGVGTILNDDAMPTVQFAGDPSAGEGSDVQFTVSLSAKSGVPVTVNYATADGTALADTDYVATSGMLTIPADTASMIVSVLTYDNLVDEPNRTFTMTLSSPGNAILGGKKTAIGTVNDNEPAPVIAIDDVTVTEVDTGGTVNALFTVSLTGSETTQTVTVHYQTASGSPAATAGQDFTSTSGDLSFAPGERSKTISVTVLGDNIDEANERFVVNLTSPTNAAFGDSQGIATIIDNDPAPTVSINDVTLVEGDYTTTPFIFTVALSTLSGQQVTVQYATADGTATTGGMDYVGVSGGSVVIPAGTLTKTVTINVSGDTSPEPDEYFLVRLTTATNATIVAGQGDVGTGTILNDDKPKLSITGVTMPEGNSGQSLMTFTVTMDTAIQIPVTVDYATSDDTATVADNDYVAASGTLTFNAGETIKTFTVKINGDASYEPDQRFKVTLTNAVNAKLKTTAPVYGTIQNDDPVPSITINDVQIVEGSAGTTNFVFTVSLSAVSGFAATVQYATANGTAQSPADYAAASGTLTFNPGDLSKQVTVVVQGDLLDENDETFFVNLSTPTNSTIGDNQGIGTILDDDPLPALSISDVQVTEGDAGTVNAVFTVTLAPVSGRTVTVDWATADGTARSPADYAAAGGSLTFLEGETTKTVTVAVNGDLLDENDETFSVNLSGQTNATIADGQGVGTILDNDPLPALSISDVQVTEGDAGTVNAVFTVTLAPVSGRTVTVNWATANGTALAPADYAAAGGTLTFVEGETTKQVTVVVQGDLLDENDETFNVNLSTPINATVSDGQGVATILDNDPLPALAISDVQVTEGDAGTVNAVFTVTLAPVSGRTVTVDWATADGTALAPADYAAAGGTLTFLEGETTKQVTVVVQGDLLDENDETFSVNLSGETNATIADGQGVATITDNDPLPALSINDVQVTGGDAGTINAVFTVTLAPVSGRTVTVNWATANGTAVSPADYAAGGGMLTFIEGQTTKQVTVVVQGDTLDENDET